MRVLPLLGLLVIVLACRQADSVPSAAGGAGSKRPAQVDQAAPTATAPGPATAAPAAAAPAATPRPLVGGIQTELVAEGLQLPANLAFAPDGRLFLTEVSLGRVRVIDRGTLLAEPFASLEVAKGGEQGLLGLTLDPSFSRNHYVYLYYSEPRGDEGWRNRVVRMTDVDGRGTDLQVVLDDLPISGNRFNSSHNGGRLGFGPDGKLYVTVGDVGKSLTAQDKGKLSGKLLRINADGSVPADNPFPGSPVYAYGLRNAYGLGFEPRSGVPYVTDNGPEGRDEVNRIQPGGNYGSPEANGIRNNPRFVDPLWESHSERGGITGLTFYSGDLFPQYKNDLLFCTFTTGRLIRLRLSGQNNDRPQDEDQLSDQCNLDVLTGPDGAIYVSSVNKIQRLVPAR